jgi:hypothetical protein
VTVWMMSNSRSFPGRLFRSFTASFTKSLCTQRRPISACSDDWIFHSPSAPKFYICIDTNLPDIERLARVHSTGSPLTSSPGSALTYRSASLATARNCHFDPGDVLSSASGQRACGALRHAASARSARWRPRGSESRLSPRIRSASRGA